MIVFEHLIIDGEPGSEGIDVVLDAFFGAEVEQAGVVAQVRLLEEPHQLGIDLFAVGEFQQLVFRFDAAVLADTQEDDAVDGHLDGEVELAFVGDLGVAQGDIARQQGAPTLDLAQEGFIHARWCPSWRCYPRRICRKRPCGWRRGRRCRRSRPSARGIDRSVMYMMRPAAGLSDRLGLTRQS